jgi:hypothetical protein
VNPFLSLVGLLFALFFGVGGGTATDESGWTDYGRSAQPPGARAGAPPPAPPEPPPIVLVARAGRQTGALLRYSVESDSSGYGGETASAAPSRVTVVRPREELSISMPAAGPTQRLVVVRQLGCRDRAVFSVLLDRRESAWRPDLPRGAYELEVTVLDFEPPGGGKGTATALFGVLVDPARERAVIRATPDVFVCR